MWLQRLVAMATDDLASGELGGNAAQLGKTTSCCHHEECRAVVVAVTLLTGFPPIQGFCCVAACQECVWRRRVPPTAPTPVSIMTGTAVPH